MPPVPGGNRNNEGTILEGNAGGGMPPIPPTPVTPPAQNFGSNEPGTIYNDNVGQSQPAEPVQEEVPQQPETIVVKKGGAIAILFWVLVPLLLIVSITLACLWVSSSNDADYYSQRAAAFSSTLSDIQSIVDGPGSEPETYSSWTSYNHENNTTSSNNYYMEVNTDDTITFDYDVDSESCDYLRVYASIDGGDEETIKEVAGLGRTGSVTYKVPRSGSLTLRLVYSKDYSVNSGRDNARVYNITHHPSAVGAVHKALNDCEYYFY